MALLFGLCCAHTAIAQAKFEPPDGSIYYGYCLSGYWSEAEMDQRIQHVHDNVSDKPFVLYSMFVHAMENGRWNGWSYRPEGPNGKYVHGSGDYVKRVVERGYIPVLAWTWMDWADHSQSPTIQGLLRGEYDWYIDEWIAGIKSLDSPIFIRLSHEMDGYWYPYSEGYHGDPDRNTAEEWVQYWRYVVDRFRAAGVDNVAWVWCVDGGRAGVRDWVDYYPGDEYVDWLAIDVYSNRNGGEALLEFREAMGTHKPIMIPEGGTEDLLTPYHPNFPGNNPWIDEFYDTIINKMDDQVKAVCWFQWNDVSDVDRDPNQVPTYQKWVERSEFINEFHEGGESSGSDVPPPITIGIEAPEQVQLNIDGQFHKVSVDFVGFSGKIGSRWDIDQGDADGLTLSPNGDSCRIMAHNAGTYLIKIQAWDGESYDANFFEVIVGDGKSEPTKPDDSATPSVDIEDRLQLEANGTAKTLHATINHLEANFGGYWSVVKGSPEGLEIIDNLTSVTMRGVKPGEYQVKAQFWDSDDHVSDHMTVLVSGDEGIDDSPTPAIVASDWFEIEVGGPAYVIETIFSGFVATGSSWGVEIGDPNGLELNPDGEIAYVVGKTPGDYVVKVQAWNGALHVSKHIRVTVVEAVDAPLPPQDGNHSTEPQITGPDQLQLTVGDPAYRLETVFAGFNAKGSLWGIQQGDADGIGISSNGPMADLTAIKPGEYIVKVQAWDDGSLHVSKHITVSVTEANASEPIDNGTTDSDQTSKLPAIIGPDELVLNTGDAPTTIETVFSGFTATGSQWGTQQGDVTGLAIQSNGSTASIQGLKTGEYVVKVQAWNGPLHVSKHINVTVIAP